MNHYRHSANVERWGLLGITWKRASEFASSPRPLDVASETAGRVLKHYDLFPHSHTPSSLMPMPDDFDPYLQWLGIEPHERPANHYRLLGISLFEADPTAISQAADQRMAYVRKFQTGPRGMYTQQLLNELSAARVCLLSPHAKVSYDQMLEGIMLADPPVAEPPTIPPPQLPVNGFDSNPEEEYEPASQGWVFASCLAVLVIAGAVAGLVLWRNAQRDPLDDAFASGSPFEAPVPPSGDEYETESEPVLIYQEANGSINFSASFAQFHGPTLRRVVMNDVDVLTDWDSMDDYASWTFKVVKSPPQGIFHVEVTYAAHPESDGGKFVIAVGDQQCECAVRGTGRAVTDEYFLAVPRTGEQTLTVKARAKPSQKLMTLKSVTLRFP